MDIVATARASLKDKDDMCEVMSRIARAGKGKEEECVYRALHDSGLMLDIKVTELHLGLGLESFPCLKPRDLIQSVAARGRIDTVIGEPWESCTLYNWQDFNLANIGVRESPFPYNNKPRTP